MEDRCPSQAEALSKLDALAPGVPLLALGQTVFWDEPVKAGLALALHKMGAQRRFVAGVHDTDYFAKLPGGHESRPVFKALPHNDASTRGLWSAAGEFSALFGSETVITREQFQQAGLKVGKVVRARPGILDQATEAWRWRGLVMLGGEAQITADLPLRHVMDGLCETLDWAIQETLATLEPTSCGEKVVAADRLRQLVCEAGENGPNETLASFYKKLAPQLYAFTAGEPVPLDTTTTTELLRFNVERCGQDRFQTLALFVSPETRLAACRAYDEVVAGTETYTLDRFGSGAIPFELVIPSVGRGTIRLGNRAVIIMTPKPQFISLKKPISSLQELAQAIETKFGPNCSLVGKAITLIGMLAREFVFVFHEGASGYVKQTVRLHQHLKRIQPSLEFYPILRVTYSPWDHLSHCCAWFRLPEPLRGPFGVEEISGASFAARWREVGKEQERLLQHLGRLSRPLELIRFLGRSAGGSWQRLAEQYDQVHQQLERLNTQVRELKETRRAINARLRELRHLRRDTEIAMGEHWRAKVFEKSPSDADWAERRALQHRVEELEKEIVRERVQWQDLRRRQDELVESETIRRAHELRRDIELEAELKRLSLIRSATIASKGLRHAGHRPSAWWFPLVCPGGSWFRATVAHAQYSIEPLV
jgi:hypothetical protein